MSIRRNSRPYPFRSFQGREPSVEDVRTELEDAVKFLQEGIDGLDFTNVHGEISAAQALTVTASITESISAVETDLEAVATRTSSLESTIGNRSSGLVAAHARISLEQTVRVTQTTALAYQISTLTASVGSSVASIVEERIARIDADGTITASLVVEVSARIAGDATLAASVVTEATARVTADGFLSANYSITVTAGSVVTGMQLNSSAGGGTTSSTIDFQTNNFRVYNSSTGVTMFDLSGTDVRLGGVLVVNTAGNKVYIGTGTYANSNTGFYVDSSGQFSLKDKLTWNGTTLAVNGSITSTDGTIGGFDIDATNLNATNIALSSGGPSLKIGNTSNEYAAVEIITSRACFSVYNTSATLTGRLQGNDAAFDGGLLSLYNSAGTLTVQLAGNGGVITGVGSSITGINATNISSGTIANARLPSAISVTSVTTSALLTAGNQLAVTGNIYNSSNDSWTPNLYTGDAGVGGDTIEFQASGGQIFGRINGGSAILLG